MITGVHGQVKTSQPFDGKNRASFQEMDGLLNGRVAGDGKAIMVME
jgi:hypothetical protein